jgi:soluble cytochrome b562
MSREEPAIDQQQQAEQSKEEKLLQVVEVQDFQKIMSLPEGRRVMRRILELLHGGPIPTDVRAFNDNGSFNIEETAGNLGAWSVGQTIQVTLLDYCKENYIKMTVEGMRAKARELEKLRRARRKEQEDEDDK